MIHLQILATTPGTSRNVFASAEGICCRREHDALLRFGVWDAGSLLVQADSHPCHFGILVEDPDPSIVGDAIAAREALKTI
mmetsp:Transcript_599/g.1363  ORF Transcript_599/g.1363 Transcript_599/m.1363 type:complete len:81 (+) Transcript_599:379-621(+)